MVIINLIFFPFHLKKGAKGNCEPGYFISFCVPTINAIGTIDI